MTAKFFHGEWVPKRVQAPFPDFAIVEDNEEGDEETPGCDGYAVIDLNTGRIVSGRCLHIDSAEGSLEMAYETAWHLRDQLEDSTFSC